MKSKKNLSQNSKISENVVFAIMEIVACSMNLRKTCRRRGPYVVIDDSSSRNLAVIREGNRIAASTISNVHSQTFLQLILDVDFFLLSKTIPKFQKNENNFVQKKKKKEIKNWKQTKIDKVVFFFLLSITIQKVLMKTKQYCSYTSKIKMFNKWHSY